MEGQRLRYKKRELYKLIIARDSITAAAEAVQLAVRLKVDQNHPLFNSLCRDVISSYGRPFTDMKPFGRLPSKWEHFGDDDLQRVHNMLMEHRHKGVAHTDFIEGRVVFYPPNHPRPGGSTSPTISHEVLTQFYAPTAYPHILKLCGNLVGRLTAEINSLVENIYGNGSNLPGPTELITQEDIEWLKSH